MQFGREAVARFEQTFAQIVGQRHAVAFPYGRTGIVAALQVIGLRDREVVCPAYTCVVVPHAIVGSRNRPVFVDSRDEDFNADLDQLEAVLTPASGAFVATSLFGYPVDLDRLTSLRRQHPDLRVIQDCAHSFAAEWRGKRVNRAGDCAVFGLNISKLMTSVFGGMVTTDNDEIARGLRDWRAQNIAPPAAWKSMMRFLYLLAVYPSFHPLGYAMVNYLERAGFLDRFTKYYDAGKIELPADYLVGMTEVEARVGLVQCGRYADIIQHRRTIAAAYDRALAGSEDVRLPPILPGATYSHYVVRVPDRPAVLGAALQRGVQLGQLIEYCIPDMPAYRSYARSGDDFSRARRMASETVNLPLHISEAQVSQVAAILGQSTRTIA
jgi:dTDP-4-amino-4,6-dideoxygalactose transaminase